MKAIIMAGGRGTRLLPISEKAPKPMTELLGRPLLEHIVELLRANGFNELCLTLGHKPEAIMSHFGNGEGFGVSIEYRVEDEPRGTAGGLLACASFIGTDDFLIMSGDCACDFELRKLMRYHKRKGALLSMALYSHSLPLEYGTVLTDRKDKIFNFIEKPPWERVVTDLINTGIYVMSPRVLAQIPSHRPSDLARDLFPALMQENEKLFGFPAEGYWCDIGSPSSYLQCSMDALEGRLCLSKKLYPQGPSQICSAKISPDAKINPPCFVGENVEIGKDTVLGRCVITSGSKIGAYSSITSSVVNSAQISEACVVDGTIICAGARLSPMTVTSCGDVISPGRRATPTKKEPSIVAANNEFELIHTVACINRAALMRQLSMTMVELGADFSQGISLTQEGVALRISPMADCCKVSIFASGGDAITRSRLCQKYMELATQFGC